MWRDTLSHVLLATLAQSVKEGWRQDMLQPPQHLKQQQQQQQAPKQQPLELQLQPQGSGGGTAQQLMARWVLGNSACRRSAAGTERAAHCHMT
jgi:hypothetical protein